MLPEDEHTPDDVDGEGLRGWATPATTPARAEVAAAALAGWIVVDPDDADDHGHPIPERAVAAAPSVDRLTLPVPDTAGRPPDAAPTGPTRPTLPTRADHGRHRRATCRPCRTPADRWPTRWPTG